MILAAGFGTRMGALTMDRPKPLIAVNGSALLDHAIEALRGAGVTRIVVNGHYKAEQIKAHIAGMPDVTFSDESSEILDSGGGVKAAIPLLRADALVTLNADAVFTGPNPIETILKHWAPEHMDALTLMVPQAHAVGRKGGGDFAMDETGRLSWNASGAVYSGAQILKASLFENTPQGPFSLHEIWNKAMAAGRMFGTMHSGRWADVGHPEGIALAEAMLHEEL